MSFTYDSDGLRLTKTVGGIEHRYTWQGGKLISERRGEKTLEFFYGPDGSIDGFNYKANANSSRFSYYYVKNLQGDVVAVVNTNGELRAEYTYDPFGKVLSAIGTMADINPIRYRGYFYDSELGFYYLQSRYYDPEICRFINADGLASTGQGFLGCNMFAYCNNNSVNKADHEGLCCNPVLPIEDDDEEGIVKYDVPLYNQGWTSLCWAFCQVMMEAYYGNEDLSQWEARQRAKQISIGLNGTGRKNWNVTGTPAYLSDRIEVNSIQELYDCLVEHGPLYANYQWENGGHSVIVTGVDVKRDIVYTNNPWGLEGQQTFSEFVSGVARRFYDPNHDYELYGLYYYDKP